MKTLKELVRKILEENPKCRDNYKELIWETWRQLGLIYNTHPECITYEDFMRAPQPESIRRPAQQEFRSDSLLGENKIQPSRRVKEKRVKLSQSKGYEFIQGKFNPDKRVYEI